MSVFNVEFVDLVVASVASHSEGLVRAFAVLHDWLIRFFAGLLGKSPGESQARNDRLDE